MGFADAAMKRVRRCTRLALNEVGRRSVADIRETINTPVTWDDGYAIRSDPGEPPYREKGLLWRSIKYRVAAGAASLEDLRVYTALYYATWLEYGTEHIEPRPFMEPGWKRLRRYGPRVFKEEFKRRWQEDYFYNPDPIVDVYLPDSAME